MRTDAAGSSYKTRSLEADPQVRVETSAFAQIDSRLSYGHVAGPGSFATTVTRPRLFGNYLKEQIRLILRAHKVPVEVGPSNEPIP